MTARRLAGMVGLGLVLALGDPAAASLRDLCAKGGVVVPPHTTVIGTIGLTGKQCQGGFENNCEAGFKIGFKPEDQLVKLDTMQIAACRCYATCLLSGGGYSGLLGLLGFGGVKDEARKKYATDYLNLMDQLDAYNAARPASPSPGAPPPPAGPCTITADHHKITIPTASVTVTVTATVPGGTAEVMFHATKAHGSDLDKAGVPTPGKKDQFTTTYQYFINADEKDTEIVYTLTKPACASSARVTLERLKTTALLMGKNPLGVGAGADLDLDLKVTGAGDFQWLGQISSDGNNWVSANTMGMEKEQPGGGDRIVKVKFYSFPPLPPTVPLRLIRVLVTNAANDQIPSNSIRVYLKPKVNRRQEQCTRAKTRLVLNLHVENPDKVDIVLNGTLQPDNSTAGPVTGKGPVVGPLSLDLNPPGGGREVTLRLTAHVRLLGFPDDLFYPDPSQPAGRETISIPAAPPQNRQALIGPVSVPLGVLEEEDCDCECNVDDADDDGDGVPNPRDNCPSPPHQNPDQKDTDEDLVGDVCDNCLEAPNFKQTDTDEDGVGDVCDLCPESADDAGEDGDGDMYGAACDNCPAHYNPEQDDTDGDKKGNLCDNCPDDANEDQLDEDQDGVGNVCQEEVDCNWDTCCPEFPEACEGDCYEPCPAGQEPDPADCSICNEAADLEPPIVLIQVPAAGSTVPAGSAIQVTTLFTDAGPLDNGVTSGVFSVSGPAVASGASPGGFGIGATAQTSQIFSFGVKSDLTGIIDRNIVITAQGTDADGNASAVAAITVVAGGAGLSLLMELNPPDPGPGQAVTVTMTVTNCDPSTTQVTYSVSGTDGYAAGATLAVDSSCRASFGIPGGAPGVVDTVTATIVGAGVSRTAVYVF